MQIFRKNRAKWDPALILGVLVSIVFCEGACQKTTPAHESAVDKGDEKIAAERIAEAEPLYEGREEISKARVAVAALRQARIADYGNYEAAWKLARACYYVAEHTADDSERDDMFREGTEAGKAAVKLEPNRPDGHFWLGANYGGAAAHSTLANLSSFQDIKQEMETVLRLDEGYQGYSAYLGLGRLYLQAPRVLGGDSKRAIEYLEKGVAFSPDNSPMRFHLAEAYEANNRDGEAKKQIEDLLAMSPDPKYVAEHKDAVAKAKKLMEKFASK